MPIAAERTEFTPPPQPGLLRGLALAVIAHLLLLLALMSGLQWKRDAENVSAEAELWARVPQEAAPREVPPPPPPPAPTPEVRTPPPAPVQRDAEIALERERRQKEAEAERRRDEAERQREQKKKAEAQRKEQQAKAAAEARRKEDDKARRQEQEDKRLAQQREENLRRIQALAGGGPSSATGNAAQSSGPSASWAGRVQARVRPNIVFTESVSGNPQAEVEVRLAPDGTIVSKRVVKGSGVKSWDDAVLRALDKTEVLPRDVDGRVPPVVTLAFRPRD